MSPTAQCVTGGRRSGWSRDLFDEQILLAAADAGGVISERDGVVATEAGIAILRQFIVAAGFADGAVETIHGEEGERIDADDFGHFLNGVVGSHELRFLRRIDAVEAGVGRRRAGDAHMDFAGAGFAHHGDDLLAGSAANDGIIDEDNALAPEDGAIGIMFQLDAEMADGL